MLLPKTPRNKNLRRIRARVAQLQGLPKPSIPILISLYLLEHRLVVSQIMGKELPRKTRITTKKIIFNSLALKFYRLPCYRSNRNNKLFRSYWLNNSKNNLSPSNHHLAQVRTLVRQMPIIFLQISSSRCSVNYSNWLLKL